MENDYVMVRLARDVAEALERFVDRIASEYVIDKDVIRSGILGGMIQTCLNLTPDEITAINSK